MITNEQKLHRLTAEGEVDTGKYEVSNVQGLFVAGNASTSVPAVIVIKSDSGSLSAAQSLGAEVKRL